MTDRSMVHAGMGSDLAVALINPKYPHNVGQTIRAAASFGVPQVWITGGRVSTIGRGKNYRLPREERLRDFSAVQLYESDRPFDAFGPEVTPVAVEVRQSAESLHEFVHPENALYVFGPEDGDLDRATLGLCHRFVRIPMLHCANVSAAVWMVLYARHAQRVALGLEAPLNVVDRGAPELTELLLNEGA